jgi:hypothetical protein
MPHRFWIAALVVGKVITVREAEHRNESEREGAFFAGQTETWCL